MNKHEAMILALRNSASQVYWTPAAGHRLEDNSDFVAEVATDKDNARYEQAFLKIADELERRADRMEAAEQRRLEKRLKAIRQRRAGHSDQTR